MDEITLTTINDSIRQLNNRIDDTNAGLKLLRNENNESHRTLTKKIDTACALISKLDKKSSITKTKLDAHLEEHKKKEEKANINGVTISSIIGNICAACIGALVTLKVAGVV